MYRNKITTAATLHMTKGRHFSTSKTAKYRTKNRPKPAAKNDKTRLKKIFSLGVKTIFVSALAKGTNLATELTIKHLLHEIQEKKEAAKKAKAKTTDIMRTSLTVDLDKEPEDYPELTE